MVADDRSALGSVVGDVDSFLDGPWGRSPWLGRHTSGLQVLDLDDVDRIVASAPRVPSIRMIRRGERVDPSAYCARTRIGATTLDDVADIRKVLDHVRRGATLVLQSLHRTWAPMSAWTAALENELGWPVQANAYLTPAGSTGLAPHSDGHDVFVVQLHGRKTWFVDGLDEEAVLEVGDVAYLPSGTEHCAHTTGDSSLHLTVGVHRPTAARIARAAAELAIAQVGGQSDRSASDGGRVTDSLRSALGDVDDHRAVESLRRRPRIHGQGLLAASIRRSPLTATSQIEPVHPWELDSSTGRVRLTWPGGSLFLPARTRAALAQLATSSESVAVSELRELSGEDAQVLVRRLLDEGAAVESSALPASGGDTAAPTGARCDLTSTRA